MHWLPPRWGLRWRPRASCVIHALRLPLPLLLVSRRAPSLAEVLMGDRSSLAHHFGSSRMVSCRDTEIGELTAVTEEVTGYGPAVDPMFGLT
ncbi:hypothetical protein BHE74_00024771 [Ensete ventricosum]|nr:hypothetical protein BHE74_00024771 [Ensete ventricosum]RZR80430.1 hypothetical protein BHM03_00006466 [Ensete ventricosum]